jgi:hypothetical protein
MVLYDLDLPYVQQFSGPGGWVLKTFGATGPIWGDSKGTTVDAAKAFIDSATAKQLNPIVRVIDPDGAGGETKIAKDDYIMFIQKLASTTTGQIVVQIGNEPNLQNPDAASAQKYADMVKDIAAATAPLRASKKLKIVTAGLTPSKDKTAYITSLKAVKDSFDVWGVHVYPSWPDGNPKSYETDLGADDGIPILITEAGQGERCDITDAQVTDGALSAFKTWNNDPRILGVTIFIMVDTNSKISARGCTSWIGAARTDQSQWRPQYKALMVGGTKRAELKAAPLVCKYKLTS